MFSWWGSTKKSEASVKTPPVSESQRKKSIVHSNAPQELDCYITFTSNTALPKQVIALLIATHKFFLDSGINQSPVKERSITFDNPLVKSFEDKNKVEWHVIGKQIGKGSFGKVYHSKLKISINKANHTVDIIAVKDVVKIQHIDLKDDERDRSSQIKAAVAEAKKQAIHSTKVDAVVVEGDEIFTVVEDCGQPLSKILPTFTKDTTFEHRLQYALRLCNEMLTLKNHEIIHRDLKPDNVCSKIENEHGKEVLTVQVIDFGLAITHDEVTPSERAGTPRYMAPELLSREDAQHSYASEVYSLVLILLQIFGAKIPFKNVVLGEELLQLSKYVCLDGLFDFTIETHIDKTLVNDLEQLLLDGLLENPDARPTIELISKFFNSIANRKILYQEFQQDLSDHISGSKGTIAQEFQALEKLYKEIGLVKVPLELKDLFKSDTKKCFNPLYEDYLSAQRKSIVENLSTAGSMIGSHYQIVQDLMANSQSFSDYADKQPFQLSVFFAEQLIQEAKQKWTDFQKKYTTLASVMGSDKFKGTNSAGIAVITKIINSQEDTLKKLERMKLLGQRKIKNSLSNRYSRSHFFYDLGLKFCGKGRHENIEELYKKLADIDSLNGNNSGQQMKDITDYITKNNFVA